MTRDWFWVRHGPTHAKTMFGWTDLPADLSDRPALDRLADALPADAPVVSSDLLRARTTADAIQRDRPRLPHRPALRELHFGDWENWTHARAEAADPDRIFAFWDRPGDTDLPGGESWNRFAARVEDGLGGLPDGPIIAVAHFGVILTQLQKALQIPPHEVFARKIDHLSMTHLRETPQGWQVVAINDCP